MMPKAADPTLADPARTADPQRTCVLTSAEAAARLAEHGPNGIGGFEPP